MSLVHAVRGAAVERVFWVPDSLTAQAVGGVGDAARIVQLADEATAVSCCAGYLLGGKRAIVMMENSGLRRGAEPLARLTLSHAMHVVMLLAYRGAFGERQWWGDNHHATMVPMLDMLGIRHATVTRNDELAPTLRAAFDMYDAGQRSVAVIVHPQVLSAC